MRTTRCKFCGECNLTWRRHPTTGEWCLASSSTFEVHVCASDKIKFFTCKFCGAQDLHWVLETLPNGKKKSFLTESWGLPHACQEQIDAREKQRQKRKEEYQAVKMYVSAVPDGLCETCKGHGCNRQSRDMCSTCYGEGQFTKKNRSLILLKARKAIWPFMFKQ